MLRRALMYTSSASADDLLGKSDGQTLMSRYHPISENVAAWVTGVWDFNKGQPPFPLNQIQAGNTKVNNFNDKQIC